MSSERGRPARSEAVLLSPSFFGGRDDFHAALVSSAMDGDRKRYHAQLRNAVFFWLRPQAAIGRNRRGELVVAHDVPFIVRQSINPRG